MPTPYRVGVVGFGVAGATVSFLLARAGHTVTLFERAPQLGPVGAGILLQPSGQLVLSRLGLLDKTVAHAEPIEELHAVTQAGRQLIRLPYAEVEPGCHAYGLHRGELFEVLHEAVLANGVTIHLDHEITTCRSRSGQVFAEDTHKRKHGPFDFLLAADGARSQLRGDSRLAKYVHAYEYGTLWVNAHCQAVRRKLFQIVHGSRQLMGMLPMGEGRCSLYWGLRKDRKEALWRRGFKAWRDEVLAFSPLAEEFFDSVRDFDHVTFTTYQHVWMPRWFDRHVLFLGDAAHAMSPHLGQGVNMALLDAWAFAECLAAAPDYYTAFLRYRRIRRDHIRFYGFVTFLLSPFFQANGFIKAMGRDVALPIMTHLPWVRPRMVQTMAGIRKGFLGGGLTL
jgi:2-polyprenyl-6-methoxyphenol hydroxylase-like FAD-dependent oxidoreductase